MQAQPAPEGVGTSPVLHLDFIKLKPEAGVDGRARLEAAAASLHAIDGVEEVGLIEGDAASDFDVALWFRLRDYAALEPFGTNPEYARFLQGTVAPLLRGFAGVDVTLDTAFAGTAGTAACLALMGPDEAYDFEVREALAAWTEAVDATSTATGIAAGERQVYRGAALAFGPRRAGRPALEPFRATLVRGRARVLE
jgi:hypothetical protein